MATLQIPDLDTFRSAILDILSIPSLSSYNRALFLTDEATEIARSCADPNSPSVVTLLGFCEAYRVLCENGIKKIADKSEEFERRVYASRSRGSTSEDMATDQAAKAGQRRQGVIFGVDKGEHIAEALEALTLEKYLVEQDDLEKRRVRWADQGVMCHT
ncbi:hypothetical protein GGR57DRAFT_515116 [Xylariaceae sp. FL1272]|nr:hypothetical protein GGR57DRAFT_515116 [Xylariaceae sp. FL1272]